MSASWKPPNRFADRSSDELRIESSEEKRLRFWKDFVSFLVKDILPLLLVYLIVVVMFISCFVVLVKHGVGSKEGEAVWPIITAILAGIAGMFFGKATK